MSTDACQYFHERKKCGTLLRPRRRRRNGHLLTMTQENTATRAQNDCVGNRRTTENGYPVSSTRLGGGCVSCECAAMQAATLLSHGTILSGNGGFGFLSWGWHRASRRQWLYLARYRTYYRRVRALVETARAPMGNIRALSVASTFLNSLRRSSRSQ